MRYPLDIGISAESTYPTSISAVYRQRQITISPFTLHDKPQYPFLGSLTAWCLIASETASFLTAPRKEIRVKEPRPRLMGRPDYVSGPAIHGLPVQK